MSLDSPAQSVKASWLSALSFGLFWWQFRQLKTINLVAIAVGLLYVLIRVKPFAQPEILILGAIMTHSAAIVWRLNQSSRRESKFLYSHGFTRDQIWSSIWAASIVSGVLVCALSWMLMLFRVRFFVQDQWMENPFFPVMESREFWMPWLWFYGYLIVLPPMHFAWIRSRQISNGRWAGWALMLLAIWCVLRSCWKVVGIGVPPGMDLIFGDSSAATWVGWAVLALSFLPMSVLFIAACRVAHGGLEVSE